MRWRVPYFDLVLGAEEKRAVVEVIESNWLTAGPRIAEFEHRFAAALGEASQAISVANGTAALHLALAAVGIKAGDEVVLPSLTFVACANAVRYLDGVPVFADISSTDDWNINPADIEAKVTDRTRAIIAVHYAGYPCRMQAILDVARRHNLKVIEDCSHGPLARLEGRCLGAWGDVGCFSFFGNKNMTTGEGGMIVTRDARLAEKIRSLRSHGMTSTSYERFRGHAFGYDVDGLGYNYRLDEIRAAIGLAQLAKLSAMNLQRRKRVHRYRRKVAAELPNVRTPFGKHDGDFGYHIFPVLLPEHGPARDAVMAGMAERGVQTSIHYRPVHTFSAYADRAAQLPLTAAIAPSILSLPLYPTMHDEQMDYVIGALKECLASSI
jgi:dTDP-4-amino-4,6-dideoxygalactose transaminase